MTDQEFEEFLQSIGGLIDGWTSDDPKSKFILSRNYFEVGNGWLPLLKELITELIAIGWNKEIHQVKEKLGGLRFYVSDYPEEVSEIINKFEKVAYYTCENCGNPGEARNTRWLQTLCDECYIKTNQKIDVK